MVTPQKIKDFAKLYDPQQFHLNEVEAAKTHFGGLVASGFQTQLLCFAPFCQQVLVKSGSVARRGLILNGCGLGILILYFRLG